MSIYYVPIEKIAGLNGSGNQDAYKTLAAIIVPDLVEIEVRILEVNLGPALVAPIDQDFTVQIHRMTPGTTGTSTPMLAADIPKKHTNLRDPDWSAAVNFTVEPTTLETNPLAPMGMNDRGGFFERFSEKDAPEARQNEWLLIRIAGHALLPSANAWSGKIIVEDGF